MLDSFSILTQGGLVLWSRSFTPSPSPFDALIREALIEQRASSTMTTAGSGGSSSTDGVSRWDKDAHSLLWLLANDLDLIFCCAYQRILSLPYVADLLVAVRKAFLKAYGETVRALVESSSKGRDVLAVGAGKGTFGLFGEKGWNQVWEGWEQTFNRILREFESEAAKGSRSKRIVSSSGAQAPATPSSASEATTPALDEPADGSLDAQTIARNIAALKARQKAAQRSAGKGKGKGGESEAGSESDGTPTKPRSRKAATKWADSTYSAADVAAYDYSSDAPSPARTRGGTPAPQDDGADVDPSTLVSRDALGKRDESSGFYEVADFAGGKSGAVLADSDDEDEDDSAATSTSSSSGVIGSLFSRLSLSSSSSSSKTLTAADLAPSLQAMQQHLMSKNVAREIAEQVVAAVGKSLEGKAVPPGGWFSTRSGAGRRAVRSALEEALVRILTPKTSTDLLLDIQRKRSASAAAGKAVDPYSLTFVGVNGVGKSTNLSKVAFWLLQNRLRVLIAACDTFRSGAVEQLRVHVRNLGKLDQELGSSGAGQVELYERGYGKDAAGIAKDAITYAKQNNFDVVLIDTAGRMQDNEPLMRALAKLIAVNQPDKIIFVGEALVGNEAVDQLTKFNRSLRDFSSSASAKGGKAAGGGAGGAGEARGIDGMILTKFDTIDDKVGAALSMTYTTGQPIYFVGTGQTYSDLRTLRVGHIVGALMQE
ncbi:hypothetical protein JCM6882_007568 [Rhodosporidiobolus microsporus]